MDFDPDHLKRGHVACKANDTSLKDTDSFLAKFIVLNVENEIACNQEIIVTNSTGAQVACKIVQLES
jgi:hypothetical protein